MYCKNCGAQIDDRAVVCVNCGVPTVEGSRINSMTDVSPKSGLVALLLCLFLGGIGAHRFYVGKIGTGVLMLLTCGGLGIWVLIDLILIIIGNFRDRDEKKLVL